jgi:triacylglycerol lipase
MGTRQRVRRTEQEPERTSIWHEWVAGVELAFLRLSPIYWGYGVPRGDSSGVVLVPGFLGTDLYLSHLGSWLRRIGYQSFYSGIRMNADCPNLLIRRDLNETIEEACQSTGEKVHLIGHSLGGTIALSAAAQRPDRIASVITLGAPIRGLEAHATIQHAADLVRAQILERHGNGVLPACYTDKCTCDFVASLKVILPKSVRQTAIYAKTDGILNWRVCRTGDPEIDFEVSSTHIGMVFSPLVYSLVAQRLAQN